MSINQLPWKTWAMFNKKKYLLPSPIPFPSSLWRHFSNYVNCLFLKRQPKFFWNHIGKWNLHSFKWDRNTTIKTQLIRCQTISAIFIGLSLIWAKRRRGKKDDVQFYIIHLWGCPIEKWPKYFPPEKYFNVVSLSACFCVSTINWRFKLSDFFLAATHHFWALCAQSIEFYCGICRCFEPFSEWIFQLCRRVDTCCMDIVVCLYFHLLVSF